MDQFSLDSASGAAVCDSCGEKLSPDATFCPNCGSRKISKAGSRVAEIPYQYSLSDSASLPVVSTGGGYTHRSFSEYAKNDYAEEDASEIPSPAEDYSAEGYPTEEHPAQEYPAEEYPAEEYPAEEYPAEEYPAEEYPAEEYPAEEYPAEEYPAEEYPAEEYEYSDTDEYEDDDDETEDGYPIYIYPASKRWLSKRWMNRRRPVRRGDRKDVTAYSTVQVVSMVAAVAFLILVFLVTVTGYFVSLFSGDSNSSSVTIDSTVVSSEASGTSSTVTTQTTRKPTTTTTFSDLTLHLLPDEVRNTKFERFTLEENLFSTAMGSSYIKSGNKTYGSTGRAFDGNPDTCWQDGVKGYGQGEWLMAYNSDGSTVTVSKITFYNGYQSTKYNTAKKDMYLYNSRVKAFTLEFDDGSTEHFELEDDKEPQTFAFLKRETCYVRLTIDDVYKGSKYKDTCIAEIIYE